jgi:hypothetical protein
VISGRGTGRVVGVVVLLGTKVGMLAGLEVGARVGFEAQLERMRHRGTILTRKRSNVILLFFILLSWRREDQPRQFSF